MKTVVLIFGIVLAATGLWIIGTAYLTYLGCVKNRIPCASGWFGWSGWFGPIATDGATLTAIGLLIAITGLVAGARKP